MSGTSIARSTLLLTAANLAIRFVSMLFQVYLSARLGAAGLGLMQLISSVGMLAMTLGCASSSAPPPVCCSSVWPPGWPGAGLQIPAPFPASSFWACSSRFPA